MEEADDVTCERGWDQAVGAAATGLKDPLTYAIIGAAQKVHATLGPGFTESTYQAALEKELTLRGISIDSQRQFKVVYEGAVCGTYIPDLVVDGRVIVELKAVEDFAPQHWAQTVSYLRASGLRTGLLLNFGKRSLQVKRFSN